MRLTCRSSTGRSVPGRSSSHSRLCSRQDQSQPGGWSRLLSVCAWFSGATEVLPALTRRGLGRSETVDVLVPLSTSSAGAVEVSRFLSPLEWKRGFRSTASWCACPSSFVKGCACSRQLSASGITPARVCDTRLPKAASSRVLGGCVALGWVEVLLASTSGTDGFCQQCSCLSHKGTPE